ncbi:dUTP diphosphatase [Pelagibacteraceae bacterium]|jgi:dUTP pyrophosphatase|nr:dUTP diphosphatase [Pelagibacteraceae bacterium]|tara:strand:- start:374 stop:814 length:441 start_codon:yes stop_codon:yes gene_type:complete
MIKIQIKKLSTTVSIPKYETPGSSGMDVAAHVENNVIIFPGEKALVPTGISIAIPIGYEVQIRPRSGLAVKKNITVLNTPGTIDADYRGEIKVILFNHGKEKFIIENGDRVAQMVVCPVVQADLEEVKELSDTMRGSGGFGSTGTK